MSKLENFIHRNGYALTITPWSRSQFRGTVYDNRLMVSVNSWDVIAIGNSIEEVLQSLENILPDED